MRAASLTRTNTATVRVATQRSVWHGGLLAGPAGDSPWDTGAAGAQVVADQLRAAGAELQCPRAEGFLAVDGSGDAGCGARQQIDHILVFCVCIGVDVPDEPVRAGGATRPGPGPTSMPISD